ncbi:Retrovirus-related Pol polyprotein from transposon RE2 [Vitis vinifera]|uniref:Retrovirus-related Pol polyprotein from transposon RE2 n=1 Tax=Vitis vinifera TaxID=29760 RepID=A0A438K005_VITVI|nr:Retrovirus-related Pol polyprotein from transposon RE2 [Vitis vinifera]
MNDEFDALVQNRTWELVPSTSMQNLVGCKWVFRIKRLPEGSIDSLQYLCLTRLDISYVVNKLSQFMHHPTFEHWNVAKRLLRYLCGTLTHGLFLHKANTFSLHAFSDADWAGNKDDYTSTSAYIVYLSRHPRNDVQLLGHPQRLSIDQLPLLLQKSIGFVPFSQSLASLYLHHMLSIVTMLVPSISVLIQSFIRT